MNEWEHFPLYRNIREAIASLPLYFRTETHISGIMATDLHTLNTVLGATIEDQVVRTLNLVRNTWDSDGTYSLYSFVRQAQTFPDILLRQVSSGEVLLGIELKGRKYMEEKEGCEDTKSGGIRACSVYRFHFTDHKIHLLRFCVV